MEILKTLGIIAIGSGAIAYLFKHIGTRLIDHFFDTRLQKYEANLNIEFQSTKIKYDKEIETYKSDLQRINYEHSIKYSKLYEERAEVIKNIFRKLATVEESMGSFLAIYEPTGAVPKEEKGKQAAKDFNDLIEYFRLNEIFFLLDTSKTMVEIISKIRDAWFKYIAYPSYKKIEYYLPDPELAKVEQKMLDNWMDAWETLREEIPPLKNRLKQDLQKIIGVE